MSKKRGDTEDHARDWRVKMPDERKDSSLPPSDATTLVTPVQLPTLSVTSASGFVIHSVEQPDGRADPRKEATRQSKPLSLAGEVQDKANTQFSFPATPPKETPLRPRESWEMISDSYSISSQSEDDCEMIESCEEARKSEAQSENEKSYRASSPFKTSTAGASAFIQDDKEDVERQQYKEGKPPLRKQLSGLPLVTTSDDDIWPSRQAQIMRAQAVQESSMPTWPYKLNPLRKLGRKQRFSAKVIIAILIVGSAVGIGVGVSGVAGGSAAQVAIKPKAIA